MGTLLAPFSLGPTVALAPLLHSTASASRSGCSVGPPHGDGLLLWSAVEPKHSNMDHVWAAHRARSGEAVRGSPGRGPWRCATAGDVRRSGGQAAGPTTNTTKRRARKLHRRPPLKLAATNPIRHPGESAYRAARQELLSRRSSCADTPSGSADTPPPKALGGQVPDDYHFVAEDGSDVSLMDFFGEHETLIIYSYKVWG